MAKINAWEKTEEYESCMHLTVFVLVIMWNDLAVINVLLLHVGSKGFRLWTCYWA